MTEQSAVLAEREGALLRITLNRTNAANALSQEMVEQLISLLDDLDGIRLCVIQGNGKHFCAGFDLSDLERCSDGDLLWRFLRIEHLLQKVHHASVPVLALAHGKVIGAGADLFAACWQRVAASDAVFSMPGWNFELALGTRRFTRLVGSQLASEVLLETRKLDAQSALSCGLVTAVAAPGDFAEIIRSEQHRASLLSTDAVAHMLAMTRVDTREADIAAIVKTAGRPGLCERMASYRQRVLGQR